MIALLPLRIVLGVIFASHGYLKLFSPRFGPERFTAYLRQERLPFPAALAYGIGILELITGLCLLGGIGVKVAAVLLAVHVALALVTVGPSKGFTRLPDNAGYEYELVLLMGLISVIMAGPTPYSLSSLFDGRSQAVEIAEKAGVMPEQISPAKLFPKLAQSANDYCVSQLTVMKVKAIPFWHARVAPLDDKRAFVSPGGDGHPSGEFLEVPRFYNSSTTVKFSAMCVKHGRALLLAFDLHCNASRPEPARVLRGDERRSLGPPDRVRRVVRSPGARSPRPRRRLVWI
ncbi:MAG: DoxX family protein [Elusimicrobia bacterium]|nr:DoxX family protein [Elusimicrobiota bacterium]